MTTPGDPLASSLDNEYWLSGVDAAWITEQFAVQYSGEASIHFKLACIAAVPLLITPELVNVLRGKFLPESDEYWIAEADLLLSPLYRLVDNRLGIYEIDPRIRRSLLKKLDREQKYDIQDIARFVLKYAIGGNYLESMRATHYWLSEAILDPDKVLDAFRRTSSGSSSIFTGWLALRLGQIVDWDLIRSEVADPDKYQLFVNDLQMIMAVDAIGTESRPNLSALVTLSSLLNKALSPDIAELAEEVAQKIRRPRPSKWFSQGQLTKKLIGNPFVPEASRYEGDRWLQRFFTYDLSQHLADPSPLRTDWRTRLFVAQPALSGELEGALRQKQPIIIQGPRGSGRTTLLHWLRYELLLQGTEPLLVDSKRVSQLTARRGKSLGERTQALAWLGQVLLQTPILEDYDPPPDPLIDENSWWRWLADLANWLEFGRTGGWLFLDDGGSQTSPLIRSLISLLRPLAERGLYLVLATHDRDISFNNFAYLLNTTHWWSPEQYRILMTKRLVAASRQSQRIEYLSQVVESWSEKDVLERGPTVSHMMAWVSWLFVVEQLDEWRSSGDYQRIIRACQILLDVLGDIPEIREQLHLAQSQSVPQLQDNEEYESSDEETGREDESTLHPFEQANDQISLAQRFLEQKDYANALAAYQRAQSILEDAGQRRSDVEASFYEAVTAEVERLKRVAKLLPKLENDKQRLRELVQQGDYVAAIRLAQKLEPLADAEVQQLHEEAKKQQQANQTLVGIKQQAESYYNDGRIQDALLLIEPWRDEPSLRPLWDDWEQALKTREKERDRLWQNAQKLADAQQFSQAVKLYKQALQIDPENTRLEAELQQTQEELQKWEKIVDLLTTAKADIAANRWRTGLELYEEGRRLDKQNWFAVEWIQIPIIQNEAREQTRENTETSENVVVRAKWPDEVAKRIEDFYQIPSGLSPQDELAKQQDTLRKAVSTYLYRHHQSLTKLISEGIQPKLETDLSALADQLGQVENHWHPIQVRQIVVNFMRTSAPDLYDNVVSALKDISGRRLDVVEAANLAPKLDDTIRSCEVARSQPDEDSTALNQANQLLLRRPTGTTVFDLLQPRYERLEELRDQLEALRRTRLKGKANGELIRVERFLFLGRFDEARALLKQLAQLDLPQDSLEYEEYGRLDDWCQQGEEVLHLQKEAGSAYQKGQWVRLERRCDGILDIYDRTAFSLPLPGKEQAVSWKETAGEFHTLMPWLRRLNDYDQEHGTIATQYTDKDIQEIASAIIKAWDLASDSQYVIDQLQKWQTLTQQIANEQVEIEKLISQAHREKEFIPIKRLMEQALKSQKVVNALRHLEASQQRQKQLETWLEQLAVSQELDKEARQFRNVERQYNEASRKFREAAVKIEDIAFALSSKLMQEADKCEELYTYQEPFLEWAEKAEKLAQTGSLDDAIPALDEARRLNTLIPKAARNGARLTQAQREIVEESLRQLELATNQQDYGRLAQLLNLIEDIKFSPPHQTKIEEYRRLLVREQARQRFARSISQDDLEQAELALIELMTLSQPDNPSETEQLTQWQGQLQAGKTVSRAYQYWREWQEMGPVSGNQLDEQVKQLEQLLQELQTVRQDYQADLERWQFIINAVQRQEAIQRAIFLEQHGNYAGAATAFRMAGQMEPSDQRLLQEANRIEHALSHYLEAEKLGFEQADEVVDHLSRIDKDSRQWAPVQALFQRYLTHLREEGRLAEDIRDYRQALRYYHFIKQLEPDDFDSAHSTLSVQLREELRELRKEAGLALGDYNLSAANLGELISRIEDAVGWDVEDTSKWAPTQLRELKQRKQEIEQADDCLQQAYISLKQAHEDGNFAPVFSVFGPLSLRMKREREVIRAFFDTAVADRGRYERIRQRLDQFQSATPTIPGLNDMQKFLSTQDPEQKLAVTRTAWAVLQQALNQV